MWRCVASRKESRDHEPFLADGALRLVRVGRIRGAATRQLARATENGRHDAGWVHRGRLCRRVADVSVSALTAMPFENLLLDRDGSVASLTVNLPKVLNALNLQTLYELRRVILDLKHYDTVRAVILTGAVDKASVSGADIN